MRPLVASLLLLVLATAVPMKYTLFTHIPNPSGFTHLISSSAYDYYLLYSPNFKATKAYSPTNWSQLPNRQYTNFVNPPYRIEQLPNVDPEHLNMIYLDSTRNRLNQKIFNTWFREEVELINNNTPIGDFTHDGGQYYAFYYQGKAQIHIGNLSKMHSVFADRDYSEKGGIYDITWRPNSSEIVTCVGDEQEKQFMVYDVENEQIQEQVGFSEDMELVSMMFEPSGDLLYFMGRVNQTEYVIWYYNFDDVKIKEFERVNCDNKVDDFAIKGSFVTVVCDSHEHLWNRTDNSFIGSFLTNLKTSGLSHDGAYLSTYLSLSNDQNPTSIYKLCVTEESSYFNPNTNTCEQCDIRCQQCYYSQGQKCGQCIEKYYIGQDYTCQPCSNGCLSCVSGSNCTTCDQSSNWTRSPEGTCVCARGYTKNNGQCVGCSSFLPGCEECYDSHTCTDCQNQYYLENSGCLRCDSVFPGCNKCQNKEQCQSCIDQHYLTPDHQCNACLTNCLKCVNNSSCSKCLPDHLINSDQTSCKFCGEFMQGCVHCSVSDVCTGCAENYELNQETRHCEEVSSHRTVIIVVGVVIGAIMITIVAALLFRKFRAKNKKETLLEAEGEQQEEEI